MFVSSPFKEMFVTWASPKTTIWEQEKGQKSVMVENSKIFWSRYRPRKRINPINLEDII